MNTFFQNLEKRDKYLSFLIQRVRYNPKIIFDHELRIKSKMLYLDGIKPYVLNNYFLYFLDIALTSHEFTDKLEYNTAHLILEMLQKSEEFYKSINNKCPNIFNKKDKHFRKFSYLYKNMFNLYNYQDYDLLVSERIIEKLENIKDFKYEIEILPKEKEEKIINRILNDDYNDEESCIVNNCSCNDKLLTSTIVCNNKFLYLVDELLSDELGVNTLKSILEILIFSADVKFDKIENEILRSSYISRIGKEKFESFDYKYANELICKIRELILEKKKLNKIINFPKS